MVHLSSAVSFWHSVVTSSFTFQLKLKKTEYDDGKFYCFYQTEIKVQVWATTEINTSLRVCVCVCLDVCVCINDMHFELQEASRRHSAVVIWGFCLGSTAKHIPLSLPIAQGEAWNSTSLLLPFYWSWIIQDTHPHIHNLKMWKR